jgi:hypothetical protein
MSSSSDAIGGTSAAAAAGATSASTGISSTAESAAGEREKGAKAAAATNPSSDLTSTSSAASTAASKAREILPILHDVIRTVEKDNQDMTQKNKDSLEAAHTVQNLHRKIEALREDVHAMPGIERNKKEQMRQLHALRSQVRSQTVFRDENAYLILTCITAFRSR